MYVAKYSVLHFRNYYTRAFVFPQAQNGGVVMVTFYPYFISCDTVSTVDQVIGEYKYRDISRQQTTMSRESGIRADDGEGKEGRAERKRLNFSSN